MRFLTPFLAALLLIPACTADAASKMAGDYAMEMDTTGMPAEAAAMLKGKTLGEMKLNADGSFEGAMEMMGKKDTIKGTWKADADNVTMTSAEVSGAKRVETKAGTYKDGVITIKDSSGPQPMTMILKKKK